MSLDKAATDDSMEISGDTMKHTCDLLDYAQPSVEITGGNLPQCDDDRDTVRLRAKVQEHGSLTRRDASRLTGLKVKTLHQAALTLVEREEIKITKTKRGGQETEVYEWVG